MGPLATKAAWMAVSFRGKSVPVFASLAYTFDEEYLHVESFPDVPLVYA